jgi:hypothetical protein
MKFQNKTLTVQVRRFLESNLERSDLLRFLLHRQRPLPLLKPNKYEKKLLLHNGISLECILLNINPSIGHTFI